MEPLKDLGFLLQSYHCVGSSSAFHHYIFSFCWFYFQRKRYQTSRTEASASAWQLAANGSPKTLQNPVTCGHTLNSISVNPACKIYIFICLIQFPFVFIRPAFQKIWVCIYSLFWTKESGRPGWEQEAMVNYADEFGDREITHIFDDRTKGHGKIRNIRKT